MTKPNGIETVRERLLRLQKQNYRSTPFRPEIEKAKTVNDEIEEFKEKSLIEPIEASNLPKSNVLKRLESIEDQPVHVEPKPVEAVLEEPKEEVNEDAEDPMFAQLKTSIDKIESLKKKMLETNNYLGLYYDLKKLEQELLNQYNSAISANLTIPEQLSSKINSLLKKT